MDPKPNGISVTLLKRMPRSGTIMAVMKSRKANPRLTPWKQIMQNYAITWLAWHDPPDVFLAARMHSTVPSAYSFTATTVANLKAASSRVTPLISWTSLTHYFRHSRESPTIDKPSIRRIISPNKKTLKRTSTPCTAAREQDGMGASPARTMKPNGPRSCRAKSSSSRRDTPVTGLGYNSTN
jgi:hypothetical protein